MLRARDLQGPGSTRRRWTYVSLAVVATMIGCSSPEKDAQTDLGPGGSSSVEPGAGGTVGAAASTSCDPGQTLCGATCVDLTSDPNNCGTCGTVCVPGSGCVGATCICPAGLSVCPSGCVDTSQDVNNCGTCGTICQPGQSCTAGSCQCQAGLTACSGTCVNVLSDPANCGSCGNVCAAGQVCSAGVCSTSCAAGQTLCGSSCVDLSTDPMNCGTCGQICGAGVECVGGVCSCPAGQTLCTGVCVVTTTDPNNCGSCGNACAIGQTCTDGVCTGGTPGTGGSTGSGGAPATGGVTSSGGSGSGGEATGSGGEATGSGGDITGSGGDGCDGGARTANLTDIVAIAVDQIAGASTNDTVTLRNICAYRTAAVCTLYEPGSDTKANIGVNGANEGPNANCDFSSSDVHALIDQTTGVAFDTEVLCGGPNAFKSGSMATACVSGFNQCLKMCMPGGYGFKQLTCTDGMYAETTGCAMPADPTAATNLDGSRVSGASNTVTKNDNCSTHWAIGLDSSNVAKHCVCVEKPGYFDHDNWLAWDCQDPWW